MVKLINYQFWHVRSSQLDCYPQGQKPCFCISFASLWLISRPFHRVLDVLKSAFPGIISTEHGPHSFLLLAPHHALPNHHSLKLPPQVDWLLVYFDSSYWMLSWGASCSSGQWVLLRKGLRGGGGGKIYIKKEDRAVNYHLGVVRVLVTSYSTFKKSWKNPGKFSYEISLVFAFTVGPWSTWVWTVQVHLHVGLVFISKYYSTKWSMVGWIHGCEGTSDTRKLGAD